MPPKPANVLVRHPKRLLMDDITMHLARYANDQRCTLVIMGDVNTDTTKDDGRDLPHFKRMLSPPPPPRRGNRTPHGWFYPPPRAP